MEFPDFGKLSQRGEKSSKNTKISKGAVASITHSNESSELEKERNASDFSKPFVDNHRVEVI